VVDLPVAVRAEDEVLLVVVLVGAVLRMGGPAEVVLPAGCSTSQAAIATI
jgi:hypothetical protein